MAVKKNPNKRPLGKNSVDVDEIVRTVTIEMTFRVWLLVLTSFANFSEASQASIRGLWADVNAYGSTVRTREDIKTELEYLEGVTGVNIGLEDMPAKKITTQGDLNRFKRKTEHNAFSTTLAIIAEPIIRNKLLSEEDIAILFKRVLLTNEQIEDRSIEIVDLQEVLADEFKLLLHKNNGTVCLSTLVRDPVQQEVGEEGVAR